jgi:hypothetical protein
MYTKPVRVWYISFNLLMEIVSYRVFIYSFLISKGSITLNDNARYRTPTLRTARLLGQILAGCSIGQKTPSDHRLFPDFSSGFISRVMWGCARGISDGLTDV